MTKQEYRKIMSRSMSLLGSQNWDFGERLELPKVCDNVVYFDPLFVYEKGKGVSVYYNFSDPKQDIYPVIDYFNTKDKLGTLKKQFDLDCEEIKKIMSSCNPKNFKRLFVLITKIFPLISLSNILGDDSRENVSNVKPELVAEYRKIRKESDGILYDSWDVLTKMAEQIVPNSHRDWVEVLTFEEIDSVVFPDIDILGKRSNGYIYHKGKLFVDEKFDNFLKRNNFEILNDKISDLKSDGGIKGSVAFGGITKGIVRIVLETNDLDNIKRGNILVAPMTTPNYISGMKKASAFVTDEGGITCHASIVAREMKKPCIIGTKIATQVLKDGDLVEVDADSGIVRILERLK